MRCLSATGATISHVVVAPVADKPIDSNTLLEKRRKSTRIAARDGAMCWSQWHKAPFLPATFPEQEARLVRVFQAHWQCVIKL
ncbi:MAG TPA: hypothetical protein VL485_25185 [Ktedonobacteraceae bacterium]|nr:hypothetical protein [Ktedonobacteraceae bacterium]